jgi:hypothetical protein
LPRWQTIGKKSKLPGTLPFWGGANGGQEHGFVGVDEVVVAGTQIPFWAKKLRHYRSLRAWSQHDLAHELNQLDLQARLDGNTVSRWERGIYRPSPFYIRLLSRCLNVSAEELALVDEEESSPSPPTPPSSNERVSFSLGCLGGVDRQVTDALEEVTVTLEHLYRQLPPTAVIGPATGHLEAITTLLQSPMPDQLRRRLCSIAGETAGLVASAKASSGDAEGARQYLEVALGSAREAHDQALGAFTVAHVICAHPGYQLDPELRLRYFAEGGFGFAVRDASPKTQVWLAAKAADVHAALGRREECQRALDRAEEALRRVAREEGDTGRPRFALGSWDERWLAGEIGASLSRLGESDQARKVLDLALSWLDSGTQNDRGWLTLAKARTYIHDREPAEACRLASSVLAGASQTGYAALVDEVRALRQWLDQWGEEPGVKELDERLAAAS